MSATTGRPAAPGATRASPGSLAASGRPACPAVAAMLCVLIVSGCAGPTARMTGGAAHQSPAASRAAGGARPTAAADYLAIATPANHQLDQEVDAYRENAHRNLAAAEAALRAEAATERGFDRRLLAIGFPPQINATARTLVQVNQRRISLTELQAASPTIPVLLSFTSGHLAADAAVEAQVRIIRRELGLPPPETS